MDTYELILSVHAHEESVLGLYLSEDGDFLFSSGGDSVVNVSVTIVSTGYHSGKRKVVAKLTCSAGMVNKDV